MQDAPSRRLCWWCAEASCIDRRHNGSIVGEWGNSHRVTQVCDLEADWMTKLHRWIPGYRMSLFKGKLVWGWLIVLRKWLKVNCLSLGEKQSILMSFKFLSPRSWVDCWGWFSRVPLSVLLSYLCSLDANSVLNCHDSVWYRQCEVRAKILRPLRWLTGLLFFPFSKFSSGVGQSWRGRDF